MKQSLYTLSGLSLLARGIHAANCSTAYFSSIIPSNATLNYALWLPENSTFSDAWADANATQLPPGCAVGVNIPSSNASHFNLALYLPDKWNSRFIATGNAGFGGFTAWDIIGQLSQYGFASLSTDTGHYSNASDASWALNHPESIVDWGWRALHMSVVIGKDLTTQYYGEESAYSYYAGCSTGGRQGLKEVQEFPDDFDGVLVGAPAWWTTHQQMYAAWIGAKNLPSNASYHITTTQIEAATDEMIRQCDPQDGVTDGIIMDPNKCDFYPEALVCTPSSNISTCFTMDQMVTLYRLITDWIDVNQTLVFPAFSLGADASYLAGVTEAPSSVGTTYVLNMVVNASTYDWANMDYKLQQLSEAINPGQATADKFDLSPFQKKGGKLMHYHGFADPQIATKASIYYHAQVINSLAPRGTNVGDFYRFFTVPGMQHCMDSDVAPWYIAAAGQTVTGATHGVPGYEDRHHDSILAIMAWTENGTAPDYLVATKYLHEDVGDGVQIQRPLCPYPQVAQYKGSGEVSVAANWQCASLY